MRVRAFRRLWTAQFVANIGTWTQTVGAQWLMGDLGGSALEIALIQTATTLPVFLLVVPAGALGDVVDRRRQLLAGQSLMLAGAGLLSLMAALHHVSPGSLLALTALMAVGQGISVPVFQAIQPELVGPELIPQAALLNSANANVARAVGPALGGLLIAALGPEATFALNAVSFVGVLFVLATWRRERADRPLGAERVPAAIRAGARYIRSAPAFTSVLVRTALFMAFASALWSLLPAVARGPLGLGAGGYGLLLGCIGAGAIAGAALMSVLRTLIRTELLVTGGMVMFALTTATTGFVRSVPAVVVALLLTGLAWVAVLSTLNSSAQLLLPGWTRARALAYYQLAFMGGQALGAVGWGVLADLTGLTAAVVTSGLGLLAVTALATWRMPLPDSRHDMAWSGHWPEPPAVDAGPGPVLVTVEWRVQPTRTGEFLRAMRLVGRSRRRTGATLWGLFQDLEEPTVFLENFTVATWTEHLRQHFERGTEFDREHDERARACTIDGEPPRVRHYGWAAPARPGRHVLGHR
ncbi:MFS transporter [Amycolatopsis acidiphila]|uniref:MFS transporter n=1 Tax=Amycolatopsis acidiphila TaxID=715473 RepID=A0A558ADV5_9PSEU|nr:MFS transporter [Amycolatopsis acidiphila]